MGWRCTNTNQAAIGWDKARCPFGHDTVPGVTDVSGYRLVEHDWSAWLWFQIRRPVNASAGGVGYLFVVPGVLEIVCFNNTTNKFGGIVYDASANAVQAYAIFPAVSAANNNNAVEADPNAIKSDKWNLLGLSWDQSERKLTAIGRTEDLARDASPQVTGALPGEMAVLTAANFGVGRQYPGIAAQLGSFGLLCIRDHVIDEDDFDEVWDSRDPYAPYLLDNTGGGGNLTGVTGAKWMIGHGVLPNAYPVDNA